MRQCINPGCPNAKGMYGHTRTKNRCPIDGSQTRKFFAFSGPSVTIQRNSRTKENVSFRGQIGPCRKHGWACRAFDDCGTRR